MGEIFDRVNNDIKESMKAGQKERLDALRMFKAKLIENKTSNKPREEMDVLTSYYKQLKDSADNFPTDAPQRGQITAELKHLDPYMPKQLGAQDVQAIIQEIIANLSKSGKPVMGAVMKELSPRIKGQFDGKLANQMVVQELAKL